MLLKKKIFGIPFEYSLLVIHLTGHQIDYRKWLLISDTISTLMMMMMII